MGLDERIVATVYVLGLVACLYGIVAGITFAWRHPWMTGTERAAYFATALDFGTVTEAEVRAWERGER